MPNKSKPTPAAPTPGVVIGVAPESWTNPAAKRPAPFHFDGHGINDADGQRLAAVNIEGPYLGDGRTRNPEFDRLGNLFAAAPDLLAALEWLFQATIDEDQGGIEGAMMKARRAIARARGE